jgi:alkanesulfonate monooxygenase SsuD/methylene tetrahydromethanopterin reductase-like flavin-dependent oxidoreductase (luciferase family)
MQQPHPPFYYSGNSKESGVFAAAMRLGLGISFYPVRFAAELTQHYRAECSRHGWQPKPEQLVYRCRMAVGEDANESARLRAGLIATNDPRGGLYSGRGGHVEPPPAARPGMGLDEVRFCGDPDTVVRQIEEFYDATGMGVIDLIFGGFDAAFRDRGRAAHPPPGRAGPRAPTRPARARRSGAMSDAFAERCIDLDGTPIRCLERGHGEGSDSLSVQAATCSAGRV